MSTNEDPKPLPTARERGEEFLAEMQQANGGTLERDELGILKLVHPVRAQ